jgi:hypothetical protein
MKIENSPCKSKAFEAIHASVTALHKVGAISNAALSEFHSSSLIVNLPITSSKEEKHPESKNRKQAAI